MPRDVYGDFTVGEVDRSISGRVDLALYHKALARLENCYVKLTGPMEFRPGLIYVADCESHSARSRLIPWEEPNDRQYFIELCNAKLNFYRADTFAKVHTISTGVDFTTADIPDVCWAFDGAKTMILTHDGYAPHRLVHNTPTNDTDWTIDSPTITITGYSDTNLFKAVNKYPALCFFFATRLAFAATKGQPNYVWISCGQNVVAGTDRTLDFSLNSVAPGATGYDVTKGFAINAWASRGGRIRWIKGSSTMVFGTTAGEIAVGTGENGLSAAFPGDLKSNSAFGGSRVALTAGEAIIFMQKGKHRLRELIVNEAGQYLTHDLTMLASQIAGVDGFGKEMDFSSVPDPVLYVPRADGQMPVATYDKDNNIRAWSRFITQGSFQSIAVATDVNEVDQIWCTVQRTINGATKQYIERFSSRTWASLPLATYVDCAKVIDNGAEKTITGITQASPMVVSCASHGYSDGDKVRIRRTVGSEAVNDMVFTVDAPAGGSFALRTEDDSANTDALRFLLTLDAAPTPADFSAGDTLTDGTNTAVVISKVDSTHYICNAPSDPAGFAAGVTITSGANSRACASPFPTCAFYIGSWVSGGTVQKVQKTVTGLSFLEAATVKILADGAVAPPKTVSGGSITLDNYASRLSIGLAYRGLMQLLPLHFELSDGTSEGRMKRVDSVVVRVSNSVGAQVGPDEDHLEPLHFRSIFTPFGEYTTPQDRDLEAPFPGDYDLTASVMVVQDDPLPLTVVAIYPRVGVGQ